ncbi:hypothetical protein KAU92_05130 [Candidatus Bathyarchaeota archaeon]|nr:hypothetical protein [Candidatus Bathyarchaeota archaeon]MCK4669206.1 hypothetical protein [Candidatus Bathyarchaeota archaeon]
MKWQEFESKYPKELYDKIRQLCEEIHDEGVRRGGFSARFCSYCYKRDGWYCFPCNGTKDLFEKRYEESLAKAMSDQS